MKLDSEAGHRLTHLLLLEIVVVEELLARTLHGYRCVHSGVGHLGTRFVTVSLRYLRESHFLFHNYIVLVCRQALRVVPSLESTASPLYIFIANAGYLILFWHHLDLVNSVLQVRLQVNSRQLEILEGLG